MNRDDVPVVGQMADAGPNDPVFDSFLLFGPVVITLLARAGRNVATTLLATGYLCAFCLYVAYRVVEHRSGSST